MYIFKSVIYCAEHVNMNIPAKAVLHVKLYLYMNHVSALIKTIFELNELNEFYEWHVDSLFRE